VEQTFRSTNLVRFATFELDLRTGELRKDGVKLKFSGQPFQVLAILLEHPGEVVTREELQKRLWPDTFVDVERNLNTAVNKIREVLGDSADSPNYVETLPRRGYRFIGELEAPVPPVVPAAAVEPHRRPRHRRWWWISAGVLAIAVFGLATFFAYRWKRQQRPPDQAVLTAVPFTALSGLADSAAFSPDGSRIAFAWSPAPDTNGFGSSDLYVKALGSETLLRLTQHPPTYLSPAWSPDLSPAWSPDGTRIAFYRRAGAESGIYVVPALGGPEQKLHSTADLWKATISWSPDGKWIAFADAAPDVNHARIYLLSTETLATQPIPENPVCPGEQNPAFSHNGQFLAYWCLRNSGVSDIYFISLPDGNPKMLASSGTAFPSGLTWSVDDTKLIYSSLRKGPYAGYELDEVSVANGSMKGLGLEGNRPAVSPKGDKLAYNSFLSKTNLWRRDLAHPEAPAVELIPSSRPEYDAQYSPDGKRIAFASQRSGVQGVWTSNEDGGALVQISDPRYLSGSPQWSPDGTKIAFDSLLKDRYEIYVADVAGGKPRKLMTNISYVVRPSWSRDGKWIYFVSGGPGNEGIYRCPASGGDATALSKDPNGLNPQESFDGNIVYFASEGSAATTMLKKVALLGKTGTESDVDPPLRVRDPQSWVIASGGIYFVPAEAPRSIRYLEFSSRRIRTIFEGNKDLSTGVSVSPDGRWILYSQQGDTTGDIMLVNDFH